MRILFAYRGTRQREYARLAEYPTSHMSEVNDVQLCHAWREAGHQVDVWTERDGAPDSGKYDLLYLFKLHSVQKFVSAGLLTLPWKRVAAWYDFGKLAQACGKEQSKIASVAWGTQRLLDQEAHTLPGAHHCVVEHATIFQTRPPLPETTFNGLYLGRIPAVYRVQIEHAARHVPFKIFALKLEIGGHMILLRPNQYELAALALANAWCPKGSSFSPGVNFLADSSMLNGCFGLVPSTKYSTEMQVLSACKCWDYWALGLPVVMADNVPEACHVKADSMRGWIYTVGDDESMNKAITAALSSARERDFIDRRHALQEWVFSGHTWAHRAQEIERAQFTP